VTLHGWFAGTDSALGMMQVLYMTSALVIVFLTVYRVVMARARSATPDLLQRSQRELVES